MGKFSRLKSNKMKSLRDIWKELRKRRGGRYSSRWGIHSVHLGELHEVHQHLVVHQTIYGGRWGRCRWCRRHGSRGGTRSPGSCGEIENISIHEVQRGWRRWQLLLELWRRWWIDRAFFGTTSLLISHRGWRWWGCGTSSVSWTTFVLSALILINFYVSFCTQSLVLCSTVLEPHFDLTKIYTFIIVSRKIWASLFFRWNNACGIAIFEELLRLLTVSIFIV